MHHSVGAPGEGPTSDSGRRAAAVGSASVSPAASTAGLGLDAKSAIRILVVDDERTLRESCANVLGLDGYDVTSCARGNEARATLERRAFDIVILDLYMSQVSGLELLRLALDANPETVVIVITGNPTVENSIQALQAGAWDFLPKPFAATQLQVLVGRAAHAVWARRENREVEAELERKHGHSDKMTILGVSPAFRRVIDVARKVARTDASVFISGESGTGKEMIAQFIHRHSRRSGKSLVAVNCAAMPEALLESEMFGHYEGAFTGAVRDKPGLLEVAHGGTMLLDELTEMAPSIQAKLLRVIQDGVIRRLGGTKADRVVDVRFIAATNRDPREAIQEADLRRDLYYRLRVVPIRVPPLRERPEDTEILARHFLIRLWKQHRDARTKPPELSGAAMDALKAHPWPGNVRELQNVLEHAVVLLEPGAEIGPDELPFFDEDVDRTNEDFVNFPRQLIEERYHPARDRLIAGFEQRYLTWLVRRADGNMSEAARIAGVDRTTLYRLMEKHDMDRQSITT